MILNKGMKKMLARGFTLVELLIVIGLLGAIALIVIAAINPIEQANRARDARFRSDGAQVISAIDRYFASHSSFPWMDVSGSTLDTEDEFDYTSAGTEAVGLCGTSCTVAGLLVSSDELKNEFLSRDFIKNITDHSNNSSQPDKKLFIGKGAGSSSSVYACFVPLSKSNRENAIADEKVRSLSFDISGIPAENTACDAASDDWATAGCYVCIPE
jgi:prepilin-type N-terminal cleavage/methylation domain-containing protein